MRWKDEIVSNTIRLVPVVCFTLFLSFGSLATPEAQEKSEEGTLFEEEDLLDLDIEALSHLDVVVTSVSKSPRKVSRSPAAVFVITREEIRRSGATSIPEVLRMVPGLQVARYNANTWAITSRGFNGIFSAKLLVLIDGRSVYTPYYSGVFWNVQDTLLQDIDRIEVIRGPGATLWGANAVNGVINIITRNSRDTRGGLLAAGHGTEEQGFLNFRYGDRIGEKGHFRFYGKFFNRDTAYVREGGHDDWRVSRVGFRTDWELGERDSLNVQGDCYDGVAGRQATLTLFSPPFSAIHNQDVVISGGNLLGRWQHQFSETSNLALQIYYDRTEREEPFVVEENRDTFDIDVSHQFALPGRQSLIWGAGYQNTSDRYTGSNTMTFLDDHQTKHLFSAFVQDEIALVEDRLFLILGSKFEYNGYTGYEVQPNGRILWSPSDSHTVWASVSRAVRTPSRVEEDVIITASPPPGMPFFLGIIGDKNFTSEDLLAFEVGYRAEPLNILSVDVAAFVNHYENLLTQEYRSPVPDPRLPPPYLLLPMVFDNKMDGETYGIEVATRWKPFRCWQLQATYSYLQIQLHADGDSLDVNAEAPEGRSPHHQASLRSSLDLPEDFTLDCGLRFMGRLPGLNIDSYLELDVRLAWKPVEDLELAVVGQNLLDHRHPEYRERSGGIQATEIERSVYGMITLRF